jgi:signal transduction histidine kinase
LTPPEGNGPPRIEVHPDVLFDLGERLISDEITAIVELVKNSYDADATYASVRVDTKGKVGPDSFYKGGPAGLVVVEDDGTGMDRDEIEAGWLLVASSRKRRTKDRKQKTPRFGRTPLGDKGLGRLGVQRLGNRVELYTRKSAVEGEGEPKLLVPTGEAFHVGIDWGEARKHEKLTDVPVQLATGPDLPAGTRIVASDLRDPEYWSKRNRDELARRLGQVISPFGEVSSFEVLASVDGETLDLLKVTQRILDAAAQRINFEFADGVLRVTLAYRLAALRGQDEGAREFDRLTSQDAGLALFNHLVAKKKLPADARQDLEANWFAVVEQNRELKLLDAKLEKGHGPRREADPGPFHGAIYSYVLRDDATAAVGGAAGTDLRPLLRTQNGVRVYRDGFAVRPYGLDGDDWLGLGKQWTRASDYYGLKPANVIGFVALTAAGNQQLVEKTDREGFVANPASENFLRLMRDEVAGFSNKTTGDIRREWLKFRDKARQEELAGGIEGLDESVALRRIRRTGEASRAIRGDALTIAATADRSRSIAAGLRDGSVTDLAALARDLDELSATGQRISAAYEKHAGDLAVLPRAADLLEGSRERLQEQSSDFADLAALGLAAETLTHELRLVTDSLAKRTSDVAAHVKDQRIADRKVSAYIEFVRSAISSIRKQLSHLEPALRYVKEQVDEFDLHDFANEVAGFHKASLHAAGIAIVVDEPFADRRVRMNKGRLIQVVDNLIANSRYWLAHEIDAARISRPTIHLRGRDGALDVWDSGPGVDPSIEARLFGPFVTNKPRGEGRGLGLYISRELMQTSSGDLALLPDRNSAGSAYIFRITLPAVADA